MCDELQETDGMNATALAAGEVAAILDAGHYGNKARLLAPWREETSRGAKRKSAAEEDSTTHAMAMSIPDHPPAHHPRTRHPCQTKGQGIFEVGSHGATAATAATTATATATT